MSDGAVAVKAKTGEWTVYPGHPLVLAWEILSVFESPSAALTIDGRHGLTCPMAVSDNRISGGGGEVHAACELLQRALKGESTEALTAWADKRWTEGKAGGHHKAVEPGLAQAAKLKAEFPAKLAAWLAHAEKAA